MGRRDVGFGRRFGAGRAVFRVVFRAGAGVAGAGGRAGRRGFTTPWPLVGRDRVLFRLVEVAMCPSGTGPARGRT
jgi:hypothetical protein